MEKVTYEQIASVNAAIKTTNIRGKDYAEVNQRITAFRKVYPCGWIKTEIVSDEGGVCTFVAQVGTYADDGTKILLGMGHAQEKETASAINRTSYIENCETSAVGRALGMAGFGIASALCSAEELTSALAAQEAAQKSNGATRRAAAKKTAQTDEDKLTDDEQEAVDAAIKILDGVTDAETATAAIPSLAAVEHPSEKSRKLARRAAASHMEALGLIYDAEAKAYKAKQEVPG